MSAGPMRAGREVSRRHVVSAILTLLTSGLCVLAPASLAALAASQGVTSISAENGTSCAIETGQAYCWGQGFGDVPVAVLAGKVLTQIAAGVETTCALDSAGAAYCWGWGGYGELGDGSFANSAVPVAVDTSGVLAGKTLTQIVEGNGYTCALDSAGAAYCWGYDLVGQLGDGSTTNSSVPVAVDTGGALAAKTLTQISAGFYDHTCALDSTGAAYCWGGNEGGKLGDGTYTDSSVPVAVDTSGVLAGKTLTQLSAGYAHTCALDSAGAAYCWGDNELGQLGAGTGGGSTVPVAVDTSGVLAGRVFTQISAGGDDACVLDSDGAAYCWGDNSCGELGQGDASDGGIYCPATPVVDARYCKTGSSCGEPSGPTGSDGAPIDRESDDAGAVLTNQAFAQISAGFYHTCAMTGAGAIYCWGDNTFGELGNDSSSAISDVPVLAGPQAPATVAAIPGDTSATVAWTAPGSLDTGTLTGYTATASPGGETCTTSSAPTCTITGLTNGTTYSITVVAHTTVGDSGASAAVTVTPTNTIAFTSGPNDTVAFGTPFTFTVTAAGSPAPAITKAGHLPSGVRFAKGQSGTATISGTPSGSAAGVYPLTLTAKNTSGTVTQAFALTVTRAPAINKIRTTTARAGSAVNLPIAATGYPVPALTESGALPRGLTFTDHGNGTGAITGTPAADSSGSYSITITATSTSGTASQTFTLRVQLAARHPSLTIWLTVRS